MELRCAVDDSLNAWSEVPEYLFSVSFWRALPYDPARPWREADGLWYMLVAVDACNDTRTLPCLAGEPSHFGFKISHTGYHNLL